MAIDASIPLGIKQQDPMQPMSNMLGMMNTMQGMQARNQQMQNAQISLDERKALAPLLADPSQYTDANGDIDFNKATPMIMKAAPTTGMQYLQNLTAAQQQKTDAQRTISKQSVENNQIAMSAYADIPQDASPEHIAAVGEALKQRFGNKSMSNIVDNINQHLVELKQNGAPEEQKRALRAASQMFVPYGDKAQANTPNGPMVTDNQVTKMVNTAPFQDTPIGSPVQGTQVQAQPPVTMPIQTATGAPGIYGAQGRSIQTGPSPTDIQTNEALEKERSAARAAFGNAPIAHDNNKEILNGLEQARTGKYDSLYQTVRSLGGLVMGNGSDAEKVASARDTIKQRAAQNAIASFHAMGQQANGVLDTIQMGTGGTTDSHTAAVKMTKFADALETGKQLYQPGLEKAIENNPNIGVAAKKKFDQDWGANLDPTALRLKRAVETGDKDEISAIQKEVGGAGSPKAIELARKWKNLQSLSQTGSLSQQ